MTVDQLAEARLRAAHPHAYARCDREAATLAAMDTYREPAPAPVDRPTQDALFELEAA